MQAVGRWARQVDATTGHPGMGATGSWARLLKASPGKSIEVGSDGASLERKRCLENAYHDMSS